MASLGFTHMKRLPSKHRCISIEEFDPEGWDATAEGKEFDAQFRVCGLEKDKGESSNATATRSALANATREALASEKQLDGGLHSAGAAGREPSKRRKKAKSPAKKGEPTDKTRPQRRKKGKGTLGATQ